MGRIARAEESLGSAEQPGIVLVPTHASARAEGLGDLRLRLNRSKSRFKTARQKRRAVLVSQQQSLLLRQGVAPRPRIIVDVTACSLSRQPFAGVTFSDSSAFSQLR